MDKRLPSLSYAPFPYLRWCGVALLPVAAVVFIGCAGTSPHIRPPAKNEAVKPLQKPEKKAAPRAKQSKPSPKAKSGRPAPRAVESSLLPLPSTPRYTSRFHQRGTASYYASKFHGRRTASGERYNKYEMTAAHPKLPFGTEVRVTNLSNGKSVIVRINDRGPHTKKRIIDLSYSAARKIDMIRAGVVKVTIEVIGP